MKAKILTFVRGLMNGTPPRFQSYLKSLILLGFLTIGISQVWGVDATIATKDLPTSYSTGDKTVDDITYYISNVANYGNGMQFKSTPGYIYNKTALPNISAIELTTQSGKTGSFKITIGSSQNPSTNEQTVTNGNSYQNVPVNCSYFKITSTGTAYIASIKITYGSSTPATITYHIGSTSGTVESMVGVSLSTALKDVTTTSCDDYSTTFMGWSTASITGKVQTSPTSLLDADATVTENMEVWAVWAKETQGTQKNGSSTYTIKQSNAPSNPYVTTDVNGYQSSWSKSGTITFANNANAGMNNGSSLVVTLPEGAIATTISQTGTSNGWSTSNITLTLTAQGVSGSLTTWNDKGKSYSFTAANNDKQIYTLSCTTKSSKVAYVASVTINYTITPVSYSDYLTTCCTSWSAPTLSYTASASIGAQLDPSRGAGTTHGTLTYSSSDEDILEVNASTGVVTTKAAGTAHVIASWSSTDGHCDNSTISNDITVIAAYNITYKDKGGADFSGTHEDGYPQTHTYGTATTLKGASKDYYNFDGWFANENCTGTAIQTVAADAYTANFTLYAKWTPIEYNITYTLNGGTNASGNPAKYTYETKTITLQAPSKIGHDFQGWFKESTFENQVITIEKGSHGNVDLYAKWLVKNYTLTWDLNGGSVTTSGTAEGDVAYGTALTAPAVERTGYDFTGWKKGGVSVDFTQTVTMPAENATYVAQWTPQVYDIAYQDQGGVAYSGSNLASLPKNHTYNAETQLTDGVKTGYHFDGWFGNSECTGSAMSSVPANSYSTHFTLYAKWTINSYELTWNLNGGTVKTEGTPAGSVVYATELKAPELEKIGYHYTWSPAVPATMPASDATYSAIWAANVYTISYKDQGGGAFSGSWGTHPTQHTYGTLTNLVNPTKAHFDFVGWYINSDCSGEPLTSLAADEYLAPITLYAKWNEHDKYTVTFVDDVQGTDCSAWDMKDTYVNTQIVFHSIGDAERKAPDGDCVTDHYHFVGWIEEGTIPTKEPDNVIKAGTTSIKITKEVTYKAVWAKEL